MAQVAETDLLPGEVSEDELEPEAPASGGVLDAITPDNSPKGMAGAIGRGLLQGGSYAFGDEVQGVLGAGEYARKRVLYGLGLGGPAEDPSENIFGPTTLAQAYRGERGAARREDKEAEAAHPTAFNVSKLVGAILAPGPKGAGTVGGMAKSGAKVGGLYGLGDSEADLTKGEFLPALADTAIGSGLGAGAGAAAGALLKPARWAAGKFSGMASAARQKAADMANKPFDSAINSARGSLGGETSSGVRSIEVLKRAVDDPRLPEDLRRAAAEALASQEGAALGESTVRGTVGRFYGQAPRIEKARGALTDAVGVATPEARAAAAQAILDKAPMKSGLWEISKRLGMPLVGSAIGGVLGGAEGAGAGGLVGAATGAMMGQPGRILKNRAAHPAFQAALGDLGSKALGELAPSAVTGVVGEQAGDRTSALREKLAPYLEMLKKDKP